jgi:hypothetical protein
MLLTLTLSFEVVTEVPAGSAKSDELCKAKFAASALYRKRQLSSTTQRTIANPSSSDYS